ncbi:MAG: amino acid ABC transporter permease [Ruminococcaceae bacterium]|nr:amino acid ABC transporter permease [Oscillospiraceae bacterium]
MQLFVKVTMSLIQGLGTTMKIFSLTLLMALPLGLLISLGAMSKFKVIKFPLKMLIWVIRGTPLMLQLIIFGLGPGLIGIVGMDMFLAVIIAFVLNYACYFAEIFRGGIESISKGQYEAGAVLGYTRIQIFMRIILPQVIKRIIPPMGNEFLTLIKDTSLANTIMIYEITWNAKRMMNSEHILWPLFYSGLFYLILCGIVTVIFNYIEKKLDYYQ